MAVLYLLSYNLPSTVETRIAWLVVAVMCFNYLAWQGWRQRKTDALVHMGAFMWVGVCMYALVCAGTIQKECVLPHQADETKRGWSV